MKTREALAPMFLLTNSVTWFSLTWMVLSGITEKTSTDFILSVSTSYFGAFVASAVSGTILLSRSLRKKSSLASWILLGSITCVLSMFLVSGTQLFYSVIGAAILGASVGVGIPTCLAFFADYTEPKNRGRMGAIVFFAMQLITMLLMLPISEVAVENRFVVIAIWRLLGVLALFFFQPRATLKDEKTTISFSSIVGEKSFVLYFVPWFLFALVNFVEAPLLQQFFGLELFNTYMLYAFAISSAAAFLGGTLCDLKGRKLTSILGFVLLGVSYAVLSLFSGTYLSQIAFVLLDGVAWGILYVTLIFVVWGDLSEMRSREKYYLLGGMPFLLSGLIEAFVQPFAALVPISASFSLASFFLFLAILPLLYAPETLSEKYMRERELKIYVDRAEKIKQKYA